MPFFRKKFFRAFLTLPCTHAFNGAWGTDFTRKVFSGKRTTLVTTINRSDKLYQNAYDYIKMHTLCAREGHKCTRNFFSEKGHDLSQLLIVVKSH